MPPPPAPPTAEGWVRRFAPSITPAVSMAIMPSLRWLLGMVEQGRRLTSLHVKTETLQQRPTALDPSVLEHLRRALAEVGRRSARMSSVGPYIGTQKLVYISTFIMYCMPGGNAW